MMAPALAVGAEDGFVRLYNIEDIEEDIESSFCKHYGNQRWYVLSTFCRVTALSGQTE